MPERERHSRRVGMRMIVVYLSLLVVMLSVNFYVVTIWIWLLGHIRLLKMDMNFSREGNWLLCFQPPTIAVNSITQGQ